MSESITLPAPIIETAMPPYTKAEREYQAFQRLLPQLLSAHRGRYVAVHEGEVVDIGDEKLALALRVLSRVGNVDIHVGLVSDEPVPVDRSGVRREVHPRGDTR